MAYEAIAAAFAAAVLPVTIAAGLGGSCGVLVGWWAFGWRQRDDRRAFRRRLAASKVASSPLPAHAWRLSVVKYREDPEAERAELLALLERRVPLFALDDIEERPAWF